MGLVLAIVLAGYGLAAGTNYAAFNQYLPFIHLNSMPLLSGELLLQAD